MMQASDFQQRRTSILFGEAPALEDIIQQREVYYTKKSQKKVGVEYAKAWFWFRTTLPLSAPLLLFLSFLFPFYLDNSTDGYLFTGSVLSLVFCGLACLSWKHISPWRRHPSSLIIMICAMSAMLGVILVANTFPVENSYDGSDINAEGKTGYHDNRNHSKGCMSMSFLVQVVLLSREMWILTLSLDLLTSITNPFASYQSNLRRYHCLVWSLAILSAFWLLGVKTCQGQFLSNGACWLKVSGPDDVCLWSFLLAWVILFYINAGCVLFYAFSRISKGLEGTYATRYACVADTFRVVFFYFAYVFFMASFFLLLYFWPRDKHSHRLLVLEHFFAYLMACRGFFDSLIWFFSHGFVSSSNGAMTNLTVSNNSRARNFSSSDRKAATLTMNDIITAKLLLYNIYNYFSALISAASGGDILDRGDEEDDDVDEIASLQSYDNIADSSSSSSRSLLASRKEEKEDLSEALLPSSGAETSAGIDSINSSAGHTLSHSHGLGSYNSQSKRGQRPGRRRRRHKNESFKGLDADLSPHLNLALRKEVVLLVTKGIKESVIHMKDREQKLLDQFEGPSDNLYNDEEDQTSGSGQSGSRQSSLSDDSSLSRVSLSSHSYGERAGNIHSNNSSTINPSHLLPGKRTVLADGAFPSQRDPNGTGSMSHRFASRPSHTSRSHNYNNHSFTGHKVNTALHGLLSVLGSVRPGEYGVDHINSMSFSFANSHLAHQATPTKETASKGSDRPKVTASPSSSSSVPIRGYESPQKDPAVLARDRGFILEQYPPPAEVVFMVEGTRPFRDFRPATFRKLRQLSNISEDHYMDLISQPTQERLSEGRSGAFFFLCGDGDLVVKTVADHEGHTLLKILDQYMAHLVSHPESLLVRFLGLHSIKMYGNEFMFVVMKNVFPPGVVLNERYDIKGSWVQRNANLKVPGKVAHCRYCGEDFIEGNSEQCPEVVGTHEGTITLKDNDMTSKVRLYPEHAYQVIDAIMSDSDALCEMGLMDYSLLIGVRNSHYDVEMLRQHYSDSPMFRNEGMSTSGQTIGEVGSQSWSLRGASAGYPARVVVAPREYYFGVIDMLQTWSFSKKMEQWFKVFVLNQARDGISCVEPREFKERYQRKISNIIEHAGFVREVTGSWIGKREIGGPVSLVSKATATSAT